MGSQNFQPDNSSHQLSLPLQLRKVTFSGFPSYFQQLYLLSYVKVFLRLMPHLSLSYFLYPISSTSILLQNILKCTMFTESYEFPILYFLNCIFMADPPLRIGTISVLYYLNVNLSGIQQSSKICLTIIGLVLCDDLIKF